uniref:Interleukin 9 receptor n=1 Tax=Sus scrofa TaxID=9823 RepID=F1RGX9_PIG
PGLGAGVWAERRWTLESEALMCEVGSRLLICSCICTCVGLGVSVPGDGAGPGAGAFSCHNNNILRIDCHWSAPELGQGASPWLLFTSNHAPGSKHRCVFRASVCTVELPAEEVLVPSDDFTITFHRHVSGQEQVSLVDPQYLPRRHVKLDPPSDVQSNVSSDHCVLTWSVRPALEPLASLLSYELAFKRQEEAWERARRKDRIIGVTWLKLEAVELDPGSTYEARLRVQMVTPEDAADEEERYEGQWSEWSLPVRFPAPRRRGALARPLGQPDSALVAVSIVLLLTSLTYLLFRLSPRMKVAWYRDVPSPRPFFQPLYSLHNGDFQTWLGAHRVGPKDGVSAPQGGLAASVREAVALLTYDPTDAWRSVGLEEESSGTSLPAGALPAGLMQLAGQAPSYLPQEDWLPASPARPAPLQSEGDSDYCALDCCGEGLPPTFTGDARGSQPGLALACGLSYDQQSLDAQPGGDCVGVGHHQRPDAGEGPRVLCPSRPLSAQRPW